MNAPKIDFRPSSNGNGKNAEPFTEDHREELRAEIRTELGDLQAGKKENTLLISALTNNWSAEYLGQVAKQRGKNWRFLTALTDQILQVEGWAILTLSATAIGADMSFFMLVKSMKVLDKADDLAEEYQRQGRMDARRAAHVEAFKDNLEQLNDQSRQWFLGRVAEILGGRKHGF